MKRNLNWSKITTVIALFSPQQVLIFENRVQLEEAVTFAQKWRPPSVVLKATRHPKAAGGGWWWSGLSYQSASLMHSPSPSQSSSKRSRWSSTWPAARCPGSPPSCWPWCMAEVSYDRKHNLPNVALLTFWHVADLFRPCPVKSRSITLSTVSSQPWFVHKETTDLWCSLNQTSHTEIK